MDTNFTTGLGSWFITWMDSWKDVAGPVSALAAIFTAVVAVGTLRRAARDSHERTRPIVTAYAQIGPTFVHGSLYLVVKNFGPTAAHNVKVEFDPPVHDADIDDGSHSIRGTAAAAMSRRYEHPIRVLAPGQKLTNVWTNRADEDEPADEPSAPDELTVKVRYTDGSKRGWKTAWLARKKYRETVKLRMRDYDWEFKENPGDDGQPDQRRAKALEAMAWELWN